MIQLCGVGPVYGFRFDPGQPGFIFQNGYVIRIVIECITKGDCSNPTVKPSVDATLTTIMGRDAAAKQGTVTWDEMIKANKKVPVDLTGLKE